MYRISSEVYLDRFNECYKNIIVISPRPQDASLNSITKSITREKLSPFQELSPCYPKCVYAFVHPKKCELLCVDNIAILFGFLTQPSLPSLIDLIIISSLRFNKASLIPT